MLLSMLTPLLIKGADADPDACVPKMNLCLTPSPAILPQTGAFHWTLRAGHYEPSRRTYWLRQMQYARLGRLAMPMIGPADGRRVMSPGAGLDFRNRPSPLVVHYVFDKTFPLLMDGIFRESLGVRTLLSIAIFDTRRIPNYNPLSVSVPIQ